MSQSGRPQTSTPFPTVRYRSLGHPARLVYQPVPLLTVISENGVRLRLNIVDTPGYGDLINNEGWCAPKGL